jgi:hypothetical protein
MIAKLANSLSAAVSSSQSCPIQVTSPPTLFLFSHATTRRPKKQLKLRAKGLHKRIRATQRQVKSQNNKSNITAIN